jgi:hypothetical protein
MIREKKEPKKNRIEFIRFVYRKKTTDSNTTVKVENPRVENSIPVTTAAHIRMKKGKNDVRNFEVGHKDDLTIQKQKIVTKAKTANIKSRIL